EVNRDLVAKPIGAVPRAEPRIIRLSPLGIAQHLVGARDFEKGTGTVLSRDVRMIPAGKLTVRPLDFSGSCVRRDAQHVVVIAHSAQSNPCKTQPALSVSTGTRHRRRRPCSRYPEATIGA